MERIIVIDANAPWVRSFLNGLPQTFVIDSIRVYSLLDYLRRNDAPKLSLRKKINNHIYETVILVPGMTKTYKLSASIISTYIRFIINIDPKPLALILTTPYYANLATIYSDVPVLYYAHDVFRFYAWDKNQVSKLENYIIRNSDSVFTVAEKLKQDFKKIQDSVIKYCPTAVDKTVMYKKKINYDVSIYDKHKIFRPIAGCIGNINNGYDWNLICDIAYKNPKTNFVFIGPIQNDGCLSNQCMNRAMNLLNVYWLGPVPHDQLYKYIEIFDVCLNFLTVNEHSDRRSPLRIYDYMTSSAPILTTNIFESYEHIPYIEVCETFNKYCNLLELTLSKTYKTDLLGRRRYISINTWQHRSTILTDTIHELISE